MKMTDMVAWLTRNPDHLFKTQGGGFPRLDKIVGGQLPQTLDAFTDPIWAGPAE